MKSQTIIQIGAHIGKTNNDPIFSKACSESRLILIEPVPFLFKILKKEYCCKFPTNNFTFINQAVSDKDGKIILTIPSEKNDFSQYPAYASQLASINPDHINELMPGLITETIEIPCISLNSLIKNYKIKEIDFLCIDTEGHDYEILMNFDFLVKPKKITFEHKHMDGVKQCGKRYQTLLKKLYNKNYKLLSKTKEDTTLIID